MASIGAAFARDAAPLLEADIQPLALRSRTAAPSFVDIKLRSRQSAILEGVLELQVMAGDTLLYRQQTHELALPPGVTTRRLLLPPVTAPPGFVLEARLIFQMRKGSHDLGRFPLSDHTARGRQYLIAVCGSVPAFPQDRLRFWQTLRPEWIFQETTSITCPVMSMPANILPEDMPSAIGLCAFDVVALEGASFASLGSKQLAELSTWVEGGGSLCVAPSAPLSAEHLAFLNTLAGASDRAPAVVADPGLQLSLREGTHMLRRAGLGRLVITLAPPTTEAEINAPAWRVVLHFLTKTRHDFASSKGRLKDAGPPRYLPIEEALSGLLPRSSTMIPLPVLAAIVGTFVLLVGPGEWFILGWLRRRWWTWITFPLLSVAFAILALRTAEFYLGRDDKRSALIVTDIDSKGRILRENQLELRIPGTDRMAVSEMRRSLSIPTSFWGHMEDEFTTAPLYQGAFPNHYNLTLSLKQWKPAVQRTMSFATGAQVPELNWDLIDLRPLAAGEPESGQKLASQLRAQGWVAQIYHRGKPMIAKVRIAWDLPILLSQLRGSERHHGMAAYSPNGRDDLGDLALHDPSNPNEWLVVAAKPSPQTMHIVRHLFRSDE